MSTKICPSCGLRRPASEVFCANDGWDLTREPIAIDAPEPAPTVTPADADLSAPAEARCRNGHPVRSGDLFCPICEAEVEETEPARGLGPAQTGFGENPQTGYDAGPIPPAVAVDTALSTIGNWTLVRRIGEEGRAAEMWAAHRGDMIGESDAILVLHAAGAGASPDASAASAAATLAPRVLATIDSGRHEQRYYEVFARDGLRPLSELIPDGMSADRLRSLTAGIAGILADLGRVGVRHRDICPDAILVNGPAVNRIALTRVGAARLSASEIDTAPPPVLTRYAAPELLAGALTSASDWWSLGIVLLEAATRGACFEGIDDQAFLMHVVTTGIELPDAIDPDIKTLLQGLLARDRAERWQGEQVQSWLAGSPVALPSRPAHGREADEATALTLSGRSYRRVTTYALAAARKESWDEARDQLVHGRLSAWLESFSSGERLRAAIRNVVRRDDLDNDTKLSLALKLLNEDMPLVRAGEIVTPVWLLQHPNDGHDLVTGPAPDLLPPGGAEAWLARLKQRAVEVRRRIAALDVEVDEPSLRLHLLSASRRQLLDLWDDQRRLLPDSEHRGLAALIERATPRDEDLIILLSAAKSQFVPRSEAMTKAAELARREGIRSFDEATAGEQLALTRRELMDQLDGRIEGFARSGHERIDGWVDQYRLEKRISLPRVLVALSLPAETWQRPPRQDYVAQLLAHFEKRIGTSVSRGALARMTVGKTSARIDLTELGTPRTRAGALLDHLLQRGESPIDIDPAAFDADAQLESRLRRLVRNADLQRRETGINGLYLGFPFVVMRPRGDTAKPRIAPVLLWPVNISAEIGQRARLRLGFDRDREEVRLNPALQGMLAPDALARWEVARDHLLSGASKAESVMDELGILTDKVRERALAKLPGPDTRVAADTIDLACSAVLFHVTFVGQAIVNDIRQLQRIPPAGTGLESLLRSGGDHKLDDGAATRAGEIDRFITADSDPTQDRAVARARSGAGLVIEGPPGTGKSQTIVNLVADAIGRKQSLLLVCQKQAALDVVHKRLEREGLGERIAMVQDPTKDRRPILEQIRHQLEQLRASTGTSERWQRQRAAIIERITRLEAQLNEQHAALYRTDEISGRTYRETIADLIEIDSGESLPAAVELRRLLASTSAETSDAIAEQCGSLASLWWPSRYEDSPLHALKPLAAVAGSRTECEDDIQAFAVAERRRVEASDPRALSIKVDDATSLAVWATQNAGSLLKLDAIACAELGRFVGAFEEVGGAVPAAQGMVVLARLRDEIGAVRELGSDARLGELIGGLGDLELDGWITVSADALAPRGWFARLLGGGKASRKKLENLLSTVSPVVSDPVISAFSDAASRQRALRRLRSQLDQLHHSLGTSPKPVAGALLTKAELSAQVEALAASLARVAAIHEVLTRSPARRETMAAARQGTIAALANLFDAIMRSLSLDSARRTSRKALTRLQPWCDEKWLEAAAAHIEDNRSSTMSVDRLVEALPTLEAFQLFRARAAHLPTLALQVFAALRPLEGKTKGRALPGGTIEAIIKREARLGWKERVEAACPMLAADEAELTSLIASLAAAEEDLKRVNRQALAGNIDMGRLGDRTSWTDITRYQGPRALRLREFLQEGAPLGLMELRPVWLMNPDVASRLLPLEKCLFDLIVYDEASQMPVEYALPTLYRTRGVVVSGDEKQLPPTSFFASRAARDEEGADVDGLSDELDEEEREAAVESWNRREIQDCPNLLDLSKSVLPSEQLQVHYRSRFRELITFSNAAFYGGTLNIPVRHPQAEVDRHRPLDLVHVGGLYESRTNAAEAEQVVARLEQLWLGADGRSPTTGVVTFNRDQADLIEERLEARAEKSAEFRRVYVRERERVENGEDMGFFVKNVENVQGDERDHILFSTTFGRNAQGGFRRNFGVLGQSGGERRLNVAITRARQRITIFTSMPIELISDVLGSGGRPSQPRDYLQLYLAYADAISRGDHEQAHRLLAQLGSTRGERGRNAAGSSTGDAFVRSVAAAIADMGFTPVHAGDGSAFGIDLAIPHPGNGGFGIGIECDGADHPLLARPHAREVWRASVMRRSLPALHRISSRGWYHHRAKETARLRAAVERAMI